MVDQNKPSKLVFSEEDVTHLINLWNECIPVKDIALDMGRPFNNIRNKIKDLQKKGLIKPRDTSNSIPDEVIETYAGMYSIPLDTVNSMVTLFSGDKDLVIANLHAACEAYSKQNGFCYYLKDMVKLTFIGEPSDAVPARGADGELVLISKAVAHTRNTMSHSTFVNMCKYIASKF